MPKDDVEAELKAAVDRVLASRSRKRLVVAGPGAGKTTLFKKLLEAAAGTPRQRLILTFINTLKGDLDRSLGDAAQVFTLHGYCQYLLRRHENLRHGLSENFLCYPGLRSLVEIDWAWLKGSSSPEFVKLMRDLTCTPEQKTFYRDRTNYYDAVDFDDSVFRTYEELAADVASIPEYTLVLIDEFQDFNRMEASVIDLLAQRNPIVIAGDDDHALYSQLRSASWDYIRSHHLNGEYEIFELPFCMRCPEVIVGAVNDMIRCARDSGKLNGRIEKAYRYYAPVKADDSRRYPHIDLVETSVQRENANYFGRYIEQCIRAISREEVAQAAEKNEPVALVIGSNPYRRQVEQHLTQAGLITAKPDKSLPEREEALKILSQNAESNLGWRIILSCGDQAKARELVRQAAEATLSLGQVIENEERTAILAEAQIWAAQHSAVEEVEPDDATQSVAITSYEGSKGRSAQYVFLIGVHSGELPGNAANVKDIEVCRFLVGLTRTKKKCSVLVTRNAMGQFKRRSEFIAWIDRNRFQEKTVDRAYWEQH
jgi:superfamily I DNA/RNA helicase